MVEEKKVGGLENNQEEKHIRPNWDEYFMEMAKTASKRATCSRGRSGSIAVKDNQILVTGYVGAPKGFPDCDEVGHLMKKTDHGDGTVSNHCVRTIHAEQNLICQAAKRGVSVDGATIYCRMVPCVTCCMLLVNCGIKRVVAERHYHQGGQDILKQAGIKLDVLYDDEVQAYEGMTEKKEQ